MKTQHDLIIEYIKEHGSILPAKEHGFAYKDGFLGAELSKRCRELRAKGVLRSQKDGRFERFYLKTWEIPDRKPLDIELKVPDGWWNEPQYQRKQPKETVNQATLL